MSQAEIAQSNATPESSAQAALYVRRLVVLFAALFVGASGVWLVRQSWTRQFFWPWLPLLAAMIMGAGALRGLELWLPGDPILPRLAAFSGSRRRTIGMACLVLAALFAGGVVYHLWPDFNQWHGTPAFWVAALLLVVLGAWLLGAVGHGSPRAAASSTLWTDSRRNRQFELAAFLIILALAIFLRTYRLATIPSGIYVDETNAGLDALYINEGRDVSPFATGWYETPNGYIYYMAGMFKLFGANWFTLKWISLIPAILTVPAVYFLARLLFGPLAALSAMLFMAVSRWHLSFSRWGWNETAPPLFQVISFYFLIRGLRDRRALDYALSGLIAGVMVYTYLSSRLALATMAIYVSYWFLSEPSGLRAALRRSWIGIVLAAGATIIAVAPLGVTYLQRPFILNNRVSEISIFRDVRDQHSYAPLVANVVDMLKFFHQSGDWQGKHNLPGEPMTDPITGLLFAIGLAYAIIGWRDQRRTLLVSWLVIGLAGGFLSSHHESPQSYRSLTALPAVVMLAGDTLDRVVRAAYKWLKEQGFTKAQAALAPAGAGIFLVSALAGAAIWESNAYFGRQAHSIAVVRGFNPTENGMAHETIGALEAGTAVYLSPTFYTFSPLRFLLYGVFKSQYGRNTLDDHPYRVVVPEVNLPIPDTGQDVLMLLDSSYWPLRSFVSSLYPAAQMNMALLADGSANYMRVEVPRAQVADLQGLYMELVFADGHKETHKVANVAVERPDPQVSKVTWSGTIRIEHGATYQFQPSDGMQVFIDDEPATGERYLGRGFYRIRVLSGNGLNPKASLLWRTADTEFVNVPDSSLFRSSNLDHGLLGTYWDNENWEGAPRFQQVSPFIQLSWPDEQPIVPNNAFTARFTGELHIAAGGIYEFKMEADDGARLVVDGVALGEGLTAGQPNNFETTVQLSAGNHPIQIDYFQQGGGSALRLYWRHPGEDWAPVPPDVLIPAHP